MIFKFIGVIIISKIYKSQEKVGAPDSKDSTFHLVRLGAPSELNRTKPNESSKKLWSTSGQQLPKLIPLFLADSSCLLFCEVSCKLLSYLIQWDYLKLIGGNRRKTLNLARLPIPPLRHNWKIAKCMKHSAKYR
jgi:hypothetical protein